MKKKNVFTIIAIIILLAVLIGLVATLTIAKVADVKHKNPIVTLDVEGYGKVKIELYPEYAPNTVATIVNLVNDKYYNGKVFHARGEDTVYLGMKNNDKFDEQKAEAEKQRAEGNEYATDPERVVVDPVMASDFDKKITVDTENDYEVTIRGEFNNNGFTKNTMRFEKGTVGLYRNTYRGMTTGLEKESFDSGSSQMFITLKDQKGINGNYAAFGKVIEGLDIIEKINAIPVKEESQATGEETPITYLTEFPVIKTATVETFGTKYDDVSYQRAFDYNAFFQSEMTQYASQQGYQY